MLTKIISGGQRGVDIAALDVAIKLGIPHGGYCPKGRLSEDSPIPARYLLTELPTRSYPARTRKNVESAHATLILADVAPLTGGTKLTYDLAFAFCSRGAVRLFTAGLFVGLLTGDHPTASPAACREWLRECQGWRESFVLNVAGPRESKNPGVHGRAVAFLRAVLAENP